MQFQENTDLNHKKITITLIKYFYPDNLNKIIYFQTIIRLY